MLTQVKTCCILNITQVKTCVNVELKEGEKMRLDRKKIICAMLDANLNTKQLAEKAGVARATACSIKNGKSCNYATALKLAGALGVDVIEIIEQ